MSKGTGETACLGELPYYDPRALGTLPGHPVRPQGALVVTMTVGTEGIGTLGALISRMERSLFLASPHHSNSCDPASPSEGWCPSPGSDIHHPGSLPTIQGYV